VTLAPGNWQKLRRSEGKGVKEKESLSVFRYATLMFNREKGRETGKNKTKEIYEKEKSGADGCDNTHGGRAKGEMWGGEHKVET